MESQTKKRGRHTKTLPKKLSPDSSSSVIKVSWSLEIPNWVKKKTKQTKKNIYSAAQHLNSCTHFRLKLSFDLRATGDLITQQHRAFLYVLKQVPIYTSCLGECSRPFAVTGADLRGGGATGVWTPVAPPNRESTSIRQWQISCHDGKWGKGRNKESQQLTTR